MAKKNYVTYKDKYNTKYGYAKNASHTLEEVSKDTGVSMKGLQQIYNKGIGAYKTNPSSVRPNVKSKEQWAMARVYSAVMGGKTARIDANELKMEKGGLIALNQLNKTIYHTGNPMFRESILKQGLIPKGESESWLSDTPIEGEVIFAINSSNIADAWNSGYDDDIYEIDTTQLNNQWYLDPNFGTDENNRIITFEPIPLSAIKLVYEGSGESLDEVGEEEYEKGGQITSYTEFYDNLEIEDGSKYIGQKFNDVFPFLSRGRKTPHDFRLKVKQYEGEVERLKQDNYTTPSRKTRDLNKLAVHKKNIDKYKYLSRFYLDQKGTIIEFMKNNQMEKGGINWYGKGGIKQRFAEGGQITQYEIEAMRNYIKSDNPNPKLKESFEKVLRKFAVDPNTSDLSKFPKGKYINTYDFSGYEYMSNINEQAGVFFLLTGEYQLVSKAIFEKDYSMWLFYNYLGRINISFKACQDWLSQAQNYFEGSMPVPIFLIHTPRAKDGRSYAMWCAVSESRKAQAQSRIGRPLTFNYKEVYYYQEIGLVGNYDFNNDGWGTLYTEKKTGLLIPEYTETSFHFNTLIHEFAHCLDFQTQLLSNIEKFESKTPEQKEAYLNTENMTEAELALYSKQLRSEAMKQDNVAVPITNHFDEFVDSLIRILRACASGNIPLTQLYEQQALDVQQALAGKYGDLLLEQRIKRAKEAKELSKEEELRDNTRFSWQTSWIYDIKEYALQNSVNADLKAKISSKSKYALTLVEALELDNLITGYFNTEFKKYTLTNPTKATQRLEDIKELKKETNRIINNHYDNVKSNYNYGYKPSSELELYIRNNCDIRNFRDYKSWKECAKEKLQSFQ